MYTKLSENMPLVCKQTPMQRPLQLWKDDACMGTAALLLARRAVAAMHYSSPERTARRYPTPPPPPPTYLPLPCSNWVETT